MVIDSITVLEGAPAGSCAILMAGAAFVWTVLLTPPLIRWLRNRQFGKAIRVDGPDHAPKAGTPTMGGLAALAGIAAVSTLPIQLGHRGEVLFIIGTMAAFAVLGLIDDLAGIARRDGGRELGVGLTARRMLAAQIGLATVSAVALRSIWSSQVEPIGLALAILAIVGTVNGVNFSDGLDGLAAGLSAIAFVAFAIAIAAHSGADDPAAMLAMASAGACLGFLVFNRFPARAFMGNITSMSLGAGLAALSLSSGLWWLLPIIGAVFVAEVVSDIIQVAYFKWTSGRRLFRMAPIHHHFELGGMAEHQVVRRFWLAGLAAGGAGILIDHLISGRPWPMGP